MKNFCNSKTKTADIKIHNSINKFANSDNNFIDNINYIDCNNDKKISNCVDSCEFSKLSKMEDAQGFDEATEGKFFRRGKKDSWKNVLDDDLRKKIEENFRKEMIELGYL